MLLAVDVGNTVINLGLWQGEEMRARWSLSTEPQRSADEYAILLSQLLAQRGLRETDLRACVIACVVPPLVSAFRLVFQTFLGLDTLFVRPSVKTDLVVRTDQPSEVGPDRIANAVAVRALYGTPAVVIDFSTATTFDAISREGEYLGDAIAPGLGTSADALFRGAAQLHRVEFAAPPAALARTTAEAVQAGLIFGHAGLVEGLVGRFKAEIGQDARVVATGEFAELMAEHTPSVEHVEPDLALTGLRLIYELNRA